MKTRKTFALALVTALASLTGCAGLQENIGAIGGGAAGAGAGWGIARLAGGNDLVTGLATVVGAGAGAWLGNEIQASSEQDSKWQGLQSKSKPIGDAKRIDNGDGSYVRVQPMQYTDEAGGLSYYDAEYHFKAPKTNQPPQLKTVKATNWRLPNETEGKRIDETQPVAPASPVQLGSK